MTRKQIIVRGESFFLEPLSPSVVRVEHRDQVGWFGISRNWDVDNHPGIRPQLAGPLPDRSPAKGGLPAAQPPGTKGNGPVAVARVPGGAARLGQTVMPVGTGRMSTGSRRGGHTGWRECCGRQGRNRAPGGCPWGDLRGPVGCAVAGAPPGVLRWGLSPLPVLRRVPGWMVHRAPSEFRNRMDRHWKRRGFRPTNGAPVRVRAVCLGEGHRSPGPWCDRSGPGWC